MVPIFELTRQYESIKEEINNALGAVFKQGIFTLGEQVSRFESEFAQYIGVKHAVGVASGTDALTLSLKVLDLPGDSEVIVPANSYPSVFGLALSGLKIRLVDCDQLGIIDPAALERTVTTKTKVIVPVHLYGQPAPLSEIKKIIQGRNIYLIEDAAQAHGAQIRIRLDQPIKHKGDSNAHDSSAWKKVGSIGDLGIFSFYPTKNLGAYGDGGLITTNSDRLYQKLLQLRQYGEISRYKSIRLSGVSRLDEVQAAVLRVKLRHLDEWNRKRKEITEYYLRGLEGIGDISFLNRKPKIMDQGNRNVSDNTYDSVSSYHLFVIRTGNRNKLKDYLSKNGIGTAVHYPVPIHLTPTFKSMGYCKGDFPVSERLSDEVLSLPLFPELKDREIENVIKKIKAYFKKQSNRKK